jgi:hypothetical protein
MAEALTRVLALAMREGNGEVARLAHETIGKLLEPGGKPAVVLELAKWKGQS